MSRIGKKPIALPAGVTVDVCEGNVVTVKGPKGELTRVCRPEVKIEVAAAEIIVSTVDNSKEANAFHGLTRTLINNMVIGVTEGFKKELIIEGIGYKAQKTGKQLVMNLGFSHQVIVDEIPGITIEVPDPLKITISGPDKQLVGQFAADVRKKKVPEPYHGKGIRYVDEVIIHKEGKTAAKK
ncbi:MAG: 50S ribosomal protein L6 [Clostridia bacterium]|nr:50S ribosomal protein L6 [Clostridia bacterium]